MSGSGMTASPSWWERFVAALVSLTGRWVLAAFTALLVGADLVAVGPSWIAAATVIAFGLLNTPWLTSGTHERGLAGLIGALIALYLILILEIYLGATGLRFGPIGAEDRGWLASVDVKIIWLLNLAYRHGASTKSLVGGFVFLVVYYLVHRFTPKTTNWLNNWWAGIGGFVAVVVMFPFAHGFEVKQVAFTKAVLDVSSSLKTLGAYETAQQEAVKENAALRDLVAELHDEARDQERQALVRAIRAYAALLLELDQRGRARTRILYQPEDSYQAAHFLGLPPEVYPVPPYPPVAPVEAGQDDDVSAASVAHAEELGHKRKALLDEVVRLRRERDAALTAIRLFVEDEVNDELSLRRRSEIANAALAAIVQTVALRNMVEATRELEQRIAALSERVAREDEENKRLTGEMSRYRAFRLVTLRRDAECAAVRREISRWLTDGGAVLLKNFTENWENAKFRLERDRPPADVLDPPEGADVAGVDRSVTDELRREGRWPPGYTRDDLAHDLVPVSETAASPVGTFVDAACRARQSADDIKTALIRINADLTRTPKRPNPT